MTQMTFCEAPGGSKVALAHSSFFLSKCHYTVWYSNRNHLASWTAQQVTLEVILNNFRKNVSHTQTENKKIIQNSPKWFLIVYLLSTSFAKIIVYVHNKLDCMLQ